jgi:hypothetical protein
MMFRHYDHKNLKRATTYLSLKALRILSTSSSRWKADASRLSSFSRSASSIDTDGVDEPEAAAGFDDDDDGTEDMKIDETMMVIEHNAEICYLG